MVYDFFRERFPFFFLFFSLSVLLIAKDACAEPTVEQLMDRVTQMEGRIQELERRLALAEKEGSARESEASQVRDQDVTIEKKIGEFQDSAGVSSVFEGIDFGAGVTFVYQFTDQANGDSLSQRSEDVGDASYSIDVEFEKSMSDYGLAFLHLETGDGAGVEDELRVFSNVNRDADDSDNQIQVTEAWYEHYAGPLTLTFGKIDATILVDTNEYAHDECTQFLGRIFRNSPTIELPDNAAGARLRLSPANLVDMDFLFMDAAGDWEDFFDGGFYAGQVNIKPRFFGRGGNFRILGWVNDREHTEWDDLSETKQMGYGFGTSFDQDIADHVGVFARYGWQDPDVFLNGEDFSLEHSYSLGMQLGGNLWSREDDTLGLAFGRAVPSRDYKRAMALQAETESHFEAYYNCRINDHLTVGPNLQIIWNPYGRDAANGSKTIWVGGLRSQVDF